MLGEQANFPVICPICRAALVREGNSLVCRGERRHTFDFARSGYMNFNTRLPTSGDTREMAVARRDFLRLGAYERLKNEVSEIAAGTICGHDLLVDAGCGEGYYTEGSAEHFSFTLGVDLSKYTLDLAAKSLMHTKLADSVLYAAASIYGIPVNDGSCDCVQSIFAPIAGDEFCRILKSGGRLITAAAGAGHLHEMKEVLYDTATYNGERQDYPSSLALVKTVPICYKATLDNSSLQRLFTMTPYFYRTKKSSAERLCSLESLDVTFDFEIRVYEKA